jgi:hypothetical protein
MTNKLKRTLIERYLATPVDVLEGCIAEIYAKRRGELYQSEKPRSYDSIGWDLFLKVSQLDKFLELYEDEQKEPGHIRELIEADATDYPFYENAQSLYESWLLPSFGTWGRKSPHRERYQKLVKEGTLSEVKASMNPMLKEMQALQGERANE